jgi:dihydroorotate dehydrogenase electron transfer subunit
MITENARVLSNTRLTGNLWQIKLASPEIPELVTPGQYVHLSIPARAEHILRRPFSVHRVTAGTDEANSLTLTYQIAGQLSQHMSELGIGDECNLLGPLGQGWRLPARSKRALFVAGGVGWAALAMAAGSIAAFSVPTHILIGARNADYIAAFAPGIGDRSYPLNLYGSEAETGKATVHVATDDGSLGHHGMNTELLDELLDQFEFDYIATCGPEAMMDKVASLALARGINCELSLERRMACGMASCLSCTVKTKSGSRKVCSDGPVFDAREIYHD